MSTSAHGRAWGPVVLLPVVLGSGSLALDAWTRSWFTTGADLGLAGRLAMAELLGSGTVWAGMLVWIGWWLARPGTAALAALVAGQVALSCYAVLGILTGVHGPEIWASDAHWFGLVLIAGPMLGMVGSTAQRDGLTGLLARLLVPAGAVAEPLVRGLLVAPADLVGPVRLAGLICAAVLVLSGLVGVGVVLWGQRRGSRT